MPTGSKSDITELREEAEEKKGGGGMGEREKNRNKRKILTASFAENATVIHQSYTRRVPYVTRNSAFRRNDIAQIALENNPRALLPVILDLRRFILRRGIPFRVQLRSNAGCYARCLALDCFGEFSG